MVQGSRVGKPQALQATQGVLFGLGVTHFAASCDQLENLEKVLNVVGQHLQILIAQVRNPATLDGLELHYVCGPKGGLSGAAVLKVLAQDSFEGGGPICALNAGWLFAGFSGLASLASALFSVWRKK